MGQDKALLEFEGQTLLQHVVSVTQQVSDDVLVIGRESAPVAVSCYPDDDSQKGPLVGLLTGIGKARHNVVLALACDLPFLNAALLQELVSVLGEQDACVPIVAGRAQPLLAAYSAGIGPKIGRVLEKGERSMHALLQTLDVRWMLESEARVLDPQLISFTNVNSPAQWEELSARQRVVGSNS